MQLSFHPLGNLKHREARLQDMLTYLREELLRLMKLVAARGGIVTAHTRSRSLPYYGHSQDFLDGLREFLDLGRESGARIHVSHIQSGYTVTPAHDGLIRSAVSETLKELDRARQAGVNVT